MMKNPDNTRNISSIIKGSMSNIVIGAFVFLAFIGLFIEGISIIGIAKSSLESEISVAAERIEWAIKSYKNIAEDIGTIPELSDPNTSVERKEEILKNKSDEYGFIRCKIVNLDGYSDMDDEYRGGREYFSKAVQGQTCIVDPVVAKTDGKLTLIVAAPVWENGVYGSKVNSVVFCSIDPEILSHIVSDMEITDNTNVYVLGENGTIVASTNLSEVSEQLSHIEIAEEDLYYRKLAEIDSRAITGEEGVILSWEGEFGGKLYGIKTIDGSPNWHLIIYNPLFDYLKPLFVALVVYAFVVFVLAIILNYRSRAVANKIGNPFKEIAERLKKAADGDLSSEVLTFGDTEEIKVISNAARDLVNRLDYMVTDDEKFDSSITLTNLVGKSTIEAVQEMVKMATGLGIAISDEFGNNIVVSASEARFCGDLTRHSLVGDEKCTECDKIGSMKCIETQKCVSYFCHAGLKEYAVPIMIEGRYVGAILGGQIRANEVDEEKIRQLAIDYDINPDDYVAAAHEIRLWSQEEMDKIESVLNAASKLLSDMAHQAYMHNIKNRKKEKAAILKKVKSTSPESSIASIMKNISGSNTNDLLNPDASNVAKALFSSSVDRLVENVYDPREVIQEAIGDMELRTKGKNIDFLLDIKDGLPKYLMGDEYKISNITNRMIQNAISSTDEGYIRVDVSGDSRGYATYLKIKIRYSSGNKDAIAIDRMKRFFDRRNKFSFENHNAQEIGLITLSNVVYEVNGKIQVKENNGHGVSLSVTIPQLEASEK